jgi:cytidylate kinase
MVGRDIGTVVAPHATAKVYMDATPEERALRRHRELLSRGKTVAYGDVLRDIVRRDEIDSHRATAPLRPADDALIVDTTALTPEGVVDYVLAALAAVADSA